MIKLGLMTGRDERRIVVAMSNPRALRSADFLQRNSLNARRIRAGKTLLIFVSIRNQLRSVRPNEQSPVLGRGFPLGVARGRFAHRQLNRTHNRRKARQWPAAQEGDALTRA